MSGYGYPDHTQLPDQAGTEAIIDYSNVAPELPEVPPAPAHARQYEVFEGSIATGSGVTFEAAHRPDRWTVYLVTTNNGDIARLALGRADNRPAVRLQYRSAVTIPGQDKAITVTGQALTGNVTVIAIASSNVEVLIDNA